MIEETQFDINDTFPINPDFKQIIKYKKLDDGMWKLMTPYICGFLNSIGGQIYIGINNQNIITGVDMATKEIDQMGLRFDNHMNGLSPQVDSRLVKITFYRLVQPQKYVVTMTIHEGTQNLYYTSFLHRQAFTISSLTPRTLNREELRLRTTNSRRFCLNQEQFIYQDNIFVDNQQKITDFLFKNDLDISSKMIYIIGNTGTGKSTLVGQCINDYFERDDQVEIIQVRFDNLQNLEDIYINIVKQMDKSIIKISDEQINDMCKDHMTMLNFNVASRAFSGDLEEQSESEDSLCNLENQLFSTQLMKQSNPIHKYRLYNIFNNCVYDYKQANKTLVLCYYNCNKYISEFIPTYSCTIFLTGNQEYIIENTINQRLLKIYSKQLTKEQIESYMKNQNDAVEYDNYIYERLINLTNGNFQKIKKLVNEHKNNLIQFLDQFQKFSLRRQKIYFNEGKFDIDQKYIKPLACLSLFPDVFSYEMMQKLLLSVTLLEIKQQDNSEIKPKQMEQIENNVKQVINGINHLIFKLQGKYYLTPDLKSYCLSLVDSGFGIDIVKLILDVFFDEMKAVNEQYEKVQVLKHQMNFSDNIYMLQLCGQQINQWLKDYNQSLEFCIDMCLRLPYREEELLQILRVFMGLKVSTHKYQTLKQCVKQVVKDQI